jgi:hypothetical protein
MKFSKLLKVLVVFFILFHSQYVKAVTPTPTPEQIPHGTTVGFEIPAVVGSIRVVGFAPPNSVVTFLFNGAIGGSQIACPGGAPSICTDSSTLGFFDKTFTGIYPGIYNVGIYATDTSTPNMTTPTANLQVYIFQGEAKVVDPITLPPTLKVDKLVMKRPERQVARGMGRPNAATRIFYNNANPFPQDVPIGNDGKFAETSNRVLPLGNNFATAFIQGFGGAISSSSQIITFRVDMSADLNIDTQVDILDFSSLMFDYGSATPNDWATDINDDTSIDLVDFSIMMFNWTGA